MLRKASYVLLVLTVSIILVGACAGPSGLQGPAGPAGPPGPPGQLAIEPQPKAVAIPASGKAGAALTIIGAGFKPGEEIKVEIAIDGLHHALGYREKVEGEMKQKHLADEYGTFRVISSIPGIATPGVYSVIVTGDQGSMAYLPLQVIE